MGVKTATVDYKASGASRIAYQWLDGDQLEIRGFEFGTVTETSEAFPKGHVSYQKKPAAKNAVSTFSSIVCTVLQKIKSLPLVHSNAIEALAMMISAGHSLRNACTTSEANTADERKLQSTAFCNFLLQQTQLDSNSNVDDFPEIRAGVMRHGKEFVGKYQRCVERYHINKKICLVNGKYLCLGPVFVSEGDLVCILFGTITPFILRPLAAGTYLLIGDCFVHDIIYGEAMNILGDESTREQSFVMQ